MRQGPFDIQDQMVYRDCMPDLTKKLHHDKFQYGDIAKLTSAIPGSKGKRYKFVGAVFDESDDTTPLYYDLIDIKRGHLRNIVPEFVVKDVAASKAAQAKIARKSVE